MRGLVDADAAGMPACDVVGRLSHAGDVDLHVPVDPADRGVRAVHAGDRGDLPGVARAEPGPRRDGDGPGLPQLHTGRGRTAHLRRAARRGARRDAAGRRSRTCLRAAVAGAGTHRADSGHRRGHRPDHRPGRQGLRHHADPGPTGVPGGRVDRRRHRHPLRRARVARRRADRRGSHVRILPFHRIRPGHARCRRQPRGGIPDGRRSRQGGRHGLGARGRVGGPGRRAAGRGHQPRAVHAEPPGAPRLRGRTRRRTRIPGRCHRRRGRGRPDVRAGFDPGAHPGAGRRPRAVRRPATRAHHPGARRDGRARSACRRCRGRGGRHRGNRVAAARGR